MMAMDIVHENESPNREAQGRLGSRGDAYLDPLTDTGWAKRGRMERIRFLSIQWHITERCNNRCRHCYLSDGSSQAELDIAGLLSILDSISLFEHKWNASIDGFAISGGDPLLHPDCFSLLKELRERGKIVFLMGNPETLTEKNVDRLAELGIAKFQMSLDGLESTHDDFRSPGSFRRTIDALERLHRYGISSQVMFTLFPENRKDLLPLLRFLASQTPLDSFSFDLGVRTGSATALEGSFQKEDLKSLFSDYLAEKARLHNKGYPIFIAEKNHFLKLIRFDGCSFFPFHSKEISVASGCVAGWVSVPIHVDGSVLACRRLPMVAGKMPEQDFEEIFLESELLRKFRRPQFFPECRDCGFYYHCRGCPAVVSGLTGDPFGRNPLCFVESLSRKPKKTAHRYEPIPMKTSREEEYSLVARHFANQSVAWRGQFLAHEAIQKALCCLLQSEQERRLFFCEPDLFLRKNAIELNGTERLFVQQFIHSDTLQNRETALAYLRLFQASLQQRNNLRGP